MARVYAILILTFYLGLVSLVSIARASSVPKHWHAKKWWLQQAVCIHRYEGAWNAATGNGYEGGMQFLASTWVRAGGRIRSSGHWASVASPREQLYRAFVIWRANGGSWHEWGTAGRCGLR